MPSILELPEVEKRIESAASKYRIDGTEFEDRVQIARIAVWELIQRVPITTENLSEHEGLIRTVAERALGGEYRKTKAQKRPELSKGRSFDVPLVDEDGRTLADILDSGEASALDILIEREGPDWRAALDHAKRESYRLRTTKSKRMVIQALVELLGLTPEEAPKKINLRTFADHGLAGWLWVFFNSSPFRALNLAYPNRFLGRDMTKTPNQYWKSKRGRQRAAQALRAALKKTGYPPERYPVLLTENLIKEFKLVTPWTKLFGSSLFSFLNAAFPRQFHPWEFPVTPRGVFALESNVVKAVRWLVEEKHHIPLPDLTVGEVWDRRVTFVITRTTFMEYGLAAIMKRYHSPGPVLRLVYPDKFFPWSFNRKGKWKGEEGKRLAAEATRWLLEEHLKISPLSPVVTFEFFWRNGLSGMLKQQFNSSPTAALRNAYPELASSFRSKTL